MNGVGGLAGTTAAGLGTSRYSAAAGLDPLTAAGGYGASATNRDGLPANWDVFYRAGLQKGLKTAAATSKSKIWHEIYFQLFLLPLM